MAADTRVMAERFARPRPSTLQLLVRFAAKNSFVVAGAAIIVLLMLAAIAAPLLVGDPIALEPLARLKPPTAGHLFGTDQVGRDVLSRTVYGGRASLLIGFSVAAFSTLFGLAIGLLPSIYRFLDPIIMRIMDGLMAIPAVLLAVALVAAAKPSATNVIIALTIVEVPRVVRLVRSLVLSIREQPFVDAAISVGTNEFMLIVRHILPNTMAPLIVQATFICAAAILAEAALTFLGAGTPSETPSWGNMIAEGRLFFLVAPWIILFPGIALSLTVLAINLLGDGLRDMLDPRIARRI
jgi:peptide/nickel transport system permease protein